MQTEIDRTLIATRKSGTGLACLMIAVHDPGGQHDPARHAALDQLGAISLDRLASALRQQDQLFDLGNGQIGVVVAPLSRPGLEPVLRLAERLRITLHAPVQLGSDTIRPSVLIGLCLDSDAPDRSGRALCDAAMMALAQARRNSDCGLHVYSCPPQAGRAPAQRTSARDTTGTAPDRHDARPQPYPTGVNPGESRAPPRGFGRG